MNKFLIRFICCFVPSRKVRDKLRESIKRYKVIGNNNEVYVDGKLCKGIVPGLTIDIIGNNNKIYLPKNIKFNNCFILINKANNCVIEIENTNFAVINLFIGVCCGNNQRLKISENFHCFGANINLNEENACVEIGADVLFSNSISLWPTDGHSVVDITTNKTLNNIIAPLRIGNRCWVGEGVKFTKNAQLPDNTVVGIGSVVTKKFIQSNTIIAGNPAKVVKENISWDKRTPYKKDNK